LPEVRELAELDEQSRTDALERFALLQPHLERGAVLSALARDAQVPLRTAQRWVQLYRAHGLVGLTRQRRADRGTRRTLSEDAIKLVQGLALQRPPLSVAAIHRELCSWARASGQPEPSHDTISRVIAAIPPALVTLGHEGEKAYRDAFDLVLRRQAGSPNEVWQADHTLLDLMALDEGGRQRRPWLTLITDDYSRAICGFALSFDAPSTIRTALALRQAIWRKTEPHWGICGIPQTLYSDNGSDFTSEHLQQVAADLKIRLVHSTPGVPRGRGKVERLFRTVNQRFLCHLPGHLRGAQRRSGELLTLQQLDQRFRTFLSDYHDEEHSETRQAPLARWRGDGFLPQMPESLEQLDLLLLTIARTRKVRTDGVQFAGHRYIDPVLSAYVGEQVVVRYDPRDIAEIRLFHDGRFLCRAICPELAGEVVTLGEVAGARNRQRRALRQQLKDRQATVAQLLELRQGSAVPDQGPEPATEPQLSARPKIKLYRNERP
jgi:putative transposase